MKRLIISFLATVFYICLLTTPVWSMQFQVDFTASNFGISNGNNAPDDPVSGSFVYEGATINSAIDSLVSVDLTINGRVYLLGDVGFDNGSDYNTIGGNETTPFAVADLTDDFFLSWSRVSLIPTSFAYATLSTSGIWQTTEFDHFSVTSGITPAPVPEPSTFLLLGGGLIGLAFAARRRSKE